MDSKSVQFQTPELPSAKVVRRFWISWQVFLLTMLTVFTIIILIAAVNGDSAPTSPAG
jgi:hypothetical protein